MTTTQWIVFGITLWAVFVLVIWAIVRGGSERSDPTEDFLAKLESQVRDQDGETTPSRHQWKHAGMKAHHAE